MKSKKPEKPQVLRRKVEAIRRKITSHICGCPDMDIADGLILLEQIDRLNALVTELQTEVFRYRAEAGKVKSE